MIVKCEQCQTRFKIPDDKVTEKGVKVRCTKCQHTFRVMRESAAGAAPEADPFAAFGGGGAADPRSESAKLGDFGLGLPLPPKPSAPMTGEEGGDDAFQMPTRAVSIPAGLLGVKGLPSPSAPRAPAPSAPKAKAASANIAAPFDFSSLGPSAPAAAPFDFAALGPASSPGAPKAAPPVAAPFDLFGGSAPSSPPGARFDPFAPPAPVSGATYSMPAASSGEDLLGLRPSAPPSRPGPAKPADSAVPAFSGDISLDSLDIPGPARPLGRGSAPPPAASPPGSAGDLELDLGAGTLPSAPAKPAPKPSAPKPSAPKREPPKKEPELPTSNLLGDIPMADSGAGRYGQLPAAPPSSLLGDDEFGMPASTEDRSSLFDMPAAEAATVRETLDVTTPSPSAPGTGVPMAKLALRRVTAESFLSPQEDQVQQGRKRVARLLVNIGFAIILMAMIALVGTVYLNDGKLDGAAFSPERMKAALTAPKDFVPVDVSNGLYETRADRAVFFVRGDVLNLGSSAQRLTVRAELLDGERLVTASEAIAGAAPSPEDLYQVGSATDLEQLSKKLSQSAPPVPAGGRAPFLVAFFEYPPDLKGFRVKLVVTAEGKETAHRPP